MPDATYLELLRSGVDEWNQNRSNIHAPDLRGSNLRAAELSWVDLADAELGGSSLYRANAYHAKFSSAKIDHAMISRVNLREADLRKADLSYSDMSESDLWRANLHGASLHGADLNRTYLRRADLSGADLQWARLYSTDLEFADLRGADLRRARLQGTNLSRADFTGADLRGAVWHRTGFGDTDLSGALLSEAEFAGPSYLDPGTALRSDLPAFFMRGCGWLERLIEYWQAISERGIELFSGFISYSRKDQAFGQKLHDRLQALGIRVWLDRHELVPGDSILAEIDRGIRIWDKTLLCCSESSLESWWVEREIEKAIQKERELREARGERVLVLIPLDLDGYLFEGWQHEYKSLLTERLAADFKGWESDSEKFEREFKRVARAMTPGGGKLPPPPTRL